MSTVVITRRGGEVAIGADALETASGTKISPRYRRRPTKLLRFGETVLGFVGNSVDQLVFENVIERHGSWLSFDGRAAIFETFRRLHPLLKDEYFVRTDEAGDERDPYESSQLWALVANPGGIFEVDAWRGVSEHERFWAAGSGTQFALGAMYAAWETAADARALAEVGVLAGCEFDEGSGPPVEIEVVALAGYSAG
jgi:ATP-dependent protease HslVU (ClpYQ) peptidase subunit